MNIAAVLHSFLSVFDALATPFRAIMSVEIRDSDVVSAVTRDKAGFIAPYAALVNRPSVAAIRAVAIIKGYARVRC